MSLQQRIKLEEKAQGFINSMDAYLAETYNQETVEAYYSQFAARHDLIKEYVLFTHHSSESIAQEKNIEGAEEYLDGYMEGLGRLQELFPIWEEESKGMTFGREFLKALVNDGLKLDEGDYVFRQAAQAAARWIVRELRELSEIHEDEEMSAMWKNIAQRYVEAWNVISHAANLEVAVCNRAFRAAT